MLCFLETPVFRFALLPSYRRIITYTQSYETLCAIWYHLYHLKIVKNTHRRVFLFKNVTDFSMQLYLKENSSMGIFHVFYIVQMVRNRLKHHIYTSISMESQQIQCDEHNLSNSIACQIFHFFLSCVPPSENS